MSRPERKASRILLKYGVVGDYDGAYDWIDSSKHNDPDYSIGKHEGTFPSDGYMVIEVVDSDYIDNLETWFDAELKAAENDHKRYKELKAERDTSSKAYADECATNVYLKATLDVAMSENQRLTKIVEDYEENDDAH